MMLHIIARGRIGQGPESALVDRYLTRIPWPTKVTELPDTGGKMPTPADRSATLLLDERGRDISSMGWAQAMGRWRDDGIREMRVLIGAADGFSDTDRAQADLIVRFGQMTWPHLMVRAMAAEQLWRGYSILINHPYHREG